MFCLLKDFLFLPTEEISTFLAHETRLNKAPGYDLLTGRNLKTLTWHAISFMWHVFNVPSILFDLLLTQFKKKKNKYIPEQW